MEDSWVPMLSSDKWLHVNQTMIKSMCWQGPHYPPEITTFTRQQTQYGPDQMIADVVIHIHLFNEYMLPSNHFLKKMSYI